jgi:hypothetical protein
MTQLSRRRTALLFALPAFLVPVIEIPLVLWARASFLAMHPDYMDDPPTISHAINDPSVGLPFGDLILVITALVMMALPTLLLSYALAISRLNLSPARRAGMYMLLFLMFAFQITASTGMVLTTQYSFDTNHDMHMLGSYIFFSFQATTTLVAAILCRVLLHQQQKHAIPDHEWQFRPVMHRFRFRFAILVVGLTALFGVLFIIKDYPLPISPYAVQVIYTQFEVIVIASFVLFFGSYAVDIYHMVRHRKLRFGTRRAAIKSDDANMPVNR